MFVQEEVLVSLANMVLFGERMVCVTFSMLDELAPGTNRPPSYIRFSVLFSVLSDQP
jgi:hypothetical protein